MTMDVQTVFIGALMLCKPGVVDEIIPDLELDLFRPELRDAFAAVQGYWTARGKIRYSRDKHAASRRSADALGVCTNLRIRVCTN